MISKSTTMLYVNDTEAAMTFWTEKMGFVITDQADSEGFKSFEVAPSLDSATKFGIHNKDMVAQANPGMNVDFPSLLFEADDLEAEYKTLTENGVATNPIMEYQGMVHFTFQDNEGNYIAVRQTI
ncbi:glyoxalase/bleomycin resistance/extradiol dioxygenase family protein [Streptococcus uberis]|uniref:Glyoxalase/bleomycin resistance protein/dioxygenase superfamily protein n=1 Tax=Streptococcus uberis (strain ATCC BAA-854 / 0140J) TaxID=218495 RepID=B9DTX1_STRU0|nr:glyoxalase/bleomycin resistance/extradiol dioxygenase family protein [Streptococcus uberis]KHD41400.1 glyoxalase [Streptococcus hongkongensis]AUC24573.1 glyoxalase/bleomycin resistance/extradiol dioxygenase family protein [Streptococcus uberis]KKF43549.1 bleomycin resistance protein [Streptococcus uberis EF20/0145]KKF56557.1 bleomycin resistance protein [Streptococcus uberis 6780]MBY4763845.1 glyoxalase/bleomycin resistance/extradiol dioxygenase family protein [Streptococcus uberis]